MYHPYYIFEPQSHGHGSSMDTTQNKIMMPLPEEFTIDLSVREVITIGCSLSARDLAVYS